MGAGLTIPTAALADPPQYRIIDLHDSGVAANSIAYRISDLGEIVGELRNGVTPNHNSGSFVWLLNDAYTLDGRTMFNLSDSPIDGPTGQAIARDINIYGKIIGNTGTVGTTNSDIILWDLAPENSHIDLSSQAHLNAVGAGRALNNLDPPTIVGRRGTGLNTQGFRYILDGNIEVLNPLPCIPGSFCQEWEQYPFADIYAVADTDRTAGESIGLTIICACNDLCPGASWWDDSSSSAILLDGFETEPAGNLGRGINSEDDIVGLATIPVEGPFITYCWPRATIWAEGNGSNPEALPILSEVDPGDESTDANAISDPIDTGSGSERHIVGRSEFLEAALLWRGNPEDWTVHNLNQISCGDYLPDLQLREGHDINNHGWITGEMTVNPGTQDARQHAYLLVPRDWCPGDINAGAPDGVVNVSDLLQLLGAWGACDTELCCFEDLNGDGTVNVTDLLALIGQFGKCPGFDHLNEPDSLEEVVTDRGLTMQKWDDFVDVMENGTSGEKANYLCWMQSYLTQCQICPTCPSRDPFAD